MKYQSIQIHSPFLIVSGDDGDDDDDHKFKLLKETSGNNKLLKRLSTNFCFVMVREKLK